MGAKKTIKIEKKYVRQKPYGAYNKFNNNNGQPWCSYFQHYCLKESSKRLGKWFESCPNYAFVPTVLTWAKKNKQFHYTGKPGDLVLFDWNNNKSPDHIGILVKKAEKGNYYITIEGNTSNLSQGNGGCVQIRHREPWCILGFVRPPYNKGRKKKLKVATKLPTKTLQAGDSGSQVKLWQKFLNSLGYDAKVDGYFGAMTRRATIEFQKKHKLDADGIVGKDTLAKAQKVIDNKAKKKVKK